MQLSEVFRSLGRPALDELVRSISLGTLKTYQMFDQFKLRARLNKLNSEHLRNAAPRLWERLVERDEELARDLAQAILVSNISFIVEALDFLKIPHDGAGFFQKGLSTEQYLADGWQQRLMDEFRGKRSEALVRLYINHLIWEMNKQSEIWQ